MSDYSVPPRLLEARSALAGESWSLWQDPNAGHVVAVLSGTGTAWMEVKHDLAAAPRADIEFVAAARAAFDVLLESIETGMPLAEAELEEIASRHRRTTPGSWTCYLESEGGLGGCNVIVMDGSEADMYLWMGGRLAPDAEWVFVALVHSEMPALIEAARLLASP